MDNCLQLTSLAQALKGELVDRDDEVDMLLLATLSRHHVLFIGPPGTAKTMMCQKWAELTNLSFMRKLVTQYSSPDELFGPVDMESYKAGRFRRIIKGLAADTQLVLLDEVFKGSPSILNANLSIMEERIFDNGEPVHVPLVSMIGTSNELPAHEEGLDAFYDRFLLRKQVRYINNRDHFRQLMSLAKRAVSPTSIDTELNPDCIGESQNEIAGMKLSSATTDTLNTCWETLMDEEVVVSDRRWVQLQDVMAAHSWLRGYQVIMPESITVGQWVLWTDPKDQALVKRICMTSIDPDLATALDIQQAARKAVSELTANSTPDQIVQLMSQVQDMRVAVKEFKNPSNEISGIETELNAMIERMLDTVRNRGV